MQNFRRKLSITRALFAGIAFVSTAAASVILPGGTVAVSGTTFASRPELGGLVLEDTIVNWSADGGATFGTMQTRVVREDVAGTLDFYFRIFNDPQSQKFVAAGRFENYAGFATDVDYRIDGLGTIGPYQVKRVGAGGSSVNFVFDSATPIAVAPGQESLFLMIKTDAVNYTTSIGDLVIGPDLAGAPSGSISNLMTVYAPTSVPEPATYGLLAAGLLCLGVARRRRRPTLREMHCR